MKTSKFYTLQKKLFLGMLVAMMILPFISYAKKIPFLQSTIAPAARGYVKIKKDRNKNYVIQIHISNLAEVDKMLPTKQTYVVWMITDRDQTENIGRVMSSENISGNLKGYFETVSSYQPTKIFITAEVDESVQAPGAQVVLMTDRFWD